MKKGLRIFGKNGQGGPMESFDLPTREELSEGVTIMEEKPKAELGTNPKDLLGVKKVPLHLVPPSSIIYQALAMQDGAIKYGPYNWRENKVICSVYIAAAMRHLQQYLDGEELASDSKKPHLGHAMACLGIIIDAKETGNMVDDRPLPGAASKLIAEWETK